MMSHIMKQLAVSTKVVSIVCMVFIDKKMFFVHFYATLMSVCLHRGGQARLSNYFASELARAKVKARSSITEMSGIRHNKPRD